MSTNRISEVQRPGKMAASNHEYGINTRFGQFGCFAISQLPKTFEIYFHYFEYFFDGTNTANAFFFET